MLTKQHVSQIKTTKKSYEENLVEAPSKIYLQSRFSFHSFSLVLFIYLSIYFLFNFSNHRIRNFIQTVNFYFGKQFFRIFLHEIPVSLNYHLLRCLLIIVQVCFSLVIPVPSATSCGKEIIYHPACVRQESLDYNRCLSNILFDRCFFLPSGSCNEEKHCSTNL